MKELKRKQLAKSDIITITGHNNEAGLDAYASGDEEQQRLISNAIDNISTNNFKKSSTPFYQNTLVSMLAESKL